MVGVRKINRLRLIFVQALTADIAPKPGMSPISGTLV